MTAWDVLFFLVLSFFTLTVPLHAAERSGKPAAPSGSVTTGNATSLDVSWSASSNSGAAVSGYDLRYREIEGSSHVPDLEFSPSALHLNEGGFHSYRVRMSARPPGDIWIYLSSSDTTVATVQSRILLPAATWRLGVSVRVTGVQDRDTENDSATITHTAPDGTVVGVLQVVVHDDGVMRNEDPVFVDGESTVRSLAEHTPPGMDIGMAVEARDADGDMLTYSLSGTDSGLFEVVSTSGQLRTSALLDYESRNTYSVTVNVSDGYGGSDSIAVTINVTDVPEAPIADAGMDQRVEQGDEVTLDGSGSRDFDRGEELSYLWKQIGGFDFATVVIQDSDKAVVSFTAPAVNVEEARLKFLLTVTDKDNLSDTDEVEVTVLRKDFSGRIKELNRVILPNVAGAIISETLLRISERVEHGFSGNNFYGSGLRLGEQSSVSAALMNYGEVSEEEGVGEFGRLLLAGVSFNVLPKSFEEELASSRSGLLAFWGGGNYKNLSGNGVDSISWDGGISSGYLGSDIRVGASVLGGVLLSFSSGDFDYKGAEGVGEYELRMKGVYPYGGWRVSEGLNIWGAAGYGWGRVEIEGDEFRKTGSDADYKAGAVGWIADVGRSRGFISGGVTSFKLKGELMLGRFRVKEAREDMIERVRVDTNRLRLTFDGTHEQELSWGGVLVPSVELGVRSDWGDWESGTGFEVGGSLSYRDEEAGLSVQGHGRWLAAHGGEVEEWGAGGMIMFDPGIAGRGLWARVSPEWGESASGVESLWSGGVANMSGYGAEASGRVGADVGYGIGALGGEGVFEPYLSYGGGDYRLGTRFSSGERLELSLEGERRESGGTRVDHGVMLRGSLKFSGVD